MPDESIAYISDVDRGSFPSDKVYVNRVRSLKALDGKTQLQYWTGQYDMLEDIYATAVIDKPLHEVLSSITKGSDMPNSSPEWIVFQSEVSGSWPLAARTRQMTSHTAWVALS